MFGWQVAKLASTSHPSCTRVRERATYGNERCYANANIAVAADTMQPPSDAVGQHSCRVRFECCVHIGLETLCAWQFRMEYGVLIMV